MKFVIYYTTPIIQQTRLRRRLQYFNKQHITKIRIDTVNTTLIEKYIFTFNTCYKQKLLKPNFYLVVNVDDDKKKNGSNNFKKKRKTNLPFQ